MDPVAALGTEEPVETVPSDMGARLAQAEQVMVELVAGCRSAQDVRSDLAVYLEWLKQNPTMGGDLEKRGSDFFSWLRSR